MTMETQLMGYFPKVTIFEYKKASKNRWWMNYVLPNGTRMRVPCANAKSEAKMLARIKQGQLGNGVFSDKDKKKLKGFINQDSRISFEEAIELYLEFSKNTKSKFTLSQDECTLNIIKRFFDESGLVYLDEVTPLDCNGLLTHLRVLGRSDATVRSYRIILSKMYNQLNKLKIISIENPMAEIGKQRGAVLVRDRMPSKQEVQKLLTGLENISLNVANRSPLKWVFPFILATGCRVSEALHLEWQDLNFEKGFWHIKSKPKCPTKNGLGWQPKSRKPRIVPLLPSAIKLLEKIPKVETEASYKNDSGEWINQKAHFVFPKAQVKVLESCTMLASYGWQKCVKCKLVRDRESCPHRIVIFSRCDEVRSAWNRLCKKVGVEDLHLHDLRRYFNLIVLQEKLRLTPAEAAYWIGHSEDVNREHYSPYSFDFIQDRLRATQFDDVFGK